MSSRKPREVPAAHVLAVLPHPVMTIDGEGRITSANAASESFFQMSQAQLERVNIADVVPFGSPVLAVIDDARRRKSVVNEYRIDVGTPRIGLERIVDVNAIPLLPDGENIVMMLQERTIADKMDRQLTHEGQPGPSRRSARCWRTRSRTRCLASGAPRNCWNPSFPTPSGP